MHGWSLAKIKSQELQNTVSEMLIIQGHTLEKAHVLNMRHLAHKITFNFRRESKIGYFFNRFITKTVLTRK